MPDAIDHVLIACADPDVAAKAVETQLGLRVTGSGRHTALGTFNRLIWLGDSGARDATVGAHTIRFVPTRSAGWPIATLHLRVAASSHPTGTELRDVKLLGCRWLIRAG